MVKILVVDDEKDIRLLLKTILELDGYKVVTVASGRQCLNKLKKENFDLILLDIMMPKMSGFEVQEKIKSDPETKDIPVIMISARSDNLAKAIAKHGKYHVDDYLEKPISKNELLRAVRRALLK
ncbi:response regulator [Candidatus Woesearchaeota archaeon]|nr:MAG: response regulator [Candidatus Woesearchaeota archaeon]